MKINEITSKDVVGFLRLSEGEYTETEIAAMMAAAESFISRYTGLPKESTGGKTIYDYDDFWIAYMALCQDMNDNRTFTVSEDKMNPAVKIILDMGAHNLVG